MGEPGVVMGGEVTHSRILKRSVSYILQVHDSTCQYIWFNLLRNAPDPWICCILVSSFVSQHCPIFLLLNYSGTQRRLLDWLVFDWLRCEASTLHLQV